mmetsp:Transcript_24179/g.34658  ORF Transcript_24179/g.34658 Transcript_24179/m.34658 type:complete len:116 (-) Transcript_24179:92-439(-)
MGVADNALDGALFESSLVGMIVGLRLNIDGTTVDFMDGSLEGNCVTGRIEGSVVGIAVRTDGEIEGFFEGNEDRIAVGLDGEIVVGGLDGDFDGLWLDGDRVGEDRSSAVFPLEN